MILNFIINCISITFISWMLCVQLGCTDQSENPLNSERSTNPIDLSRLNLNSSNIRLLPLAQVQISLLSELENNEIQTKTLIDSLLIVQKKLYQATLTDPSISIQSEDEILNLIKSNLADVDLTQSLNSIKNQFEIQIQQQLGELEFQMEDLTIWSVFLDQRIQPHSGTLLFEIIRRLVSGTQKKKENNVIIFSNQDVYSGVLVWNKTHGYRLKGIKLDGQTLDEIDFGYIKDLSDVRIVDSDIFLITEIFKNQIINPLEVFKNGLQLTAEKYNLPLEKLESTIPNPLLKLNYESFDREAALTLSLRLKDPMTQSIFSFGD